MLPPNLATRTTVCVHLAEDRTARRVRKYRTLWLASFGISNRAAPAEIWRLGEMRIIA